MKTVIAKGIVLTFLVSIMSCSPNEGALKINAIDVTDGLVNISTIYTGDGAENVSRDYIMKHTQVYISPCSNNISNYKAISRGFNIDSNGKILKMNSKFTCSQPYIYLQENRNKNGPSILWAKSCLYIEVTSALGSEMKVSTVDGELNGVAAKCI